MKQKIYLKTLQSVKLTTTKECITLIKCETNKADVAYVYIHAQIAHNSIDYIVIDVHDVATLGDFEIEQVQNDAFVVHSALEFTLEFDTVDNHTLDVLVNACLTNWVSVRHFQMRVSINNKFKKVENNCLQV